MRVRATEVRKEKMETEGIVNLNFECRMRMKCRIVTINVEEMSN